MAQGKGVAEVERVVEARSPLLEQAVGVVAVQKAELVVTVEAAEAAAARQEVVASTQLLVPVAVAAVVASVVKAKMVGGLMVEEVPTVGVGRIQRVDQVALAVEATAVVVGGIQAEGV